MKPDKISLLVVENNPTDRKALQAWLKKTDLPYQVCFVESIFQTLRTFNEQDFEVILTNYSLEDGTAFDILKLTKEAPVIVATRPGEEEAAARVMKAGAYDYLIKDSGRQYLRNLPLVIANALKNRKAKEQFRLLSHAITSINESVTITDLENRLIFVNKAFLQIYGYENEYEVLGKHISILRSEHNSSEVLSGILQETLNGGWKGELWNCRKDGSEFPIFLSTSVIYDDEGNIRALSGVAQDISERKKAEQELKAAKDAAESANIAKSEFLANMSHEIRTPMNGILGMTELALETELSQEQREYLELVKNSAESLLVIINDILDFSKIEAGKLELAPIKFNLRDSLRETIKTLAIRAHQKDLELLYYVDPKIPEHLFGDPGRLRQILVNLIGNSIKFTEIGEIVLIIEQKWNKEKQTCLHFQVTDTGIGIPAEKQGKIFRSFEQADSSTTREFGGTGLGLTISSQLVQLMGGEIWVESPVKTFSLANEGPGTRFHFTAVFDIQDVQPEDQPMARLQDLGQVSVLIVDDNATNRRFLTDMLGHLQFPTETANDGPAALLKMREAAQQGKPFGLALLDVHMPLMDGFMLAEEIRKDPLLSHTPLMILTSAGKRGDMQRCRDLKIGGYLTKPISTSDLIDGILMTLKSGQLPRDNKEIVTRHSVREKRVSYRILLVEDNIVNQKLAFRLLQKMNYQVEVANNGKEALELWQNGEFDLILMDIQMPEMDGMTATVKIREQEQVTGAHIPIIALTAHAMKGDRERCLECGMDSYVSKPIKRAALEMEIKKLLQTSFAE